MSEFLSETQGCDLLARLFKARGYRIERNVLFREYGVEFHVDGWDPKARVGFEFLTSEDDDHIDLSLDEYQALATAQLKGELSLFIIDEVEPMSAADLTAQAHEFLDEVADALQARRKGRPARSSRGKAAVKNAAKARGGRKVAKKKAATKPVAKKPAAAKAAGQKQVKKVAAVKGTKKATKKVAKKATKKVARRP
ncbi:MAG: hypothetical protein ACKO6B_14205 [Planctomycetia bacterium]